MRVNEVPEFIQDKPLHSLPPKATIREAADLLIKHNIGAIPIVDEDGKLIGIFSERDFMKRVFAKRLDADTTTLENVMTENPTSIELDDDISKAIDLMMEGRYRHMPIVDPIGNLTGFLSQRDFMAVTYAEMIRLRNLQKRKSA